MDALHIGSGSRVADIGAGSGYFTFHLAKRVGPAGRVYAVDIDPGALAGISRRAAAEGLAQIVTVRSAKDDPRLPGSVDVALVVNTYHELRASHAMVEGLWRGLKPGGLLAIIDAEALGGESRESYVRHHRVPSGTVRDEATHGGFRFLRSELGFVHPELPFSYWFFLIFQRPS